MVRRPAAMRNRAKAKALPRAAEPPFRRLRIFSLDPSAALELETAGISRTTVPVRWEKLQADDGTPGPVGEYIEVVDVDPASRSVYDPVNLDDPHLLAQDGLAPSTGNPQFHQQMTYAVAMTTIANFEQALGRPILWSPRKYDNDGNYLSLPEERYVRRLRIYPHAMREQNAYYSPERKALLFGYFDATTVDPRDELPGGLVFTCLSHDIVAHETTHAILDGLQHRLLDATNDDMLAFHEAFSDIVAIFQHFTIPGVILDQIQRSRGDLRKDTWLARLAVQFARATGMGGALRNALGSVGPDGRSAPPDPTLLGRTMEPHERGAIFVAAVFDAFLQIYERRVADLRRIATGGSGVLPLGDIHPDLARRFSDEAVRSAQHVLNICIRALDYLPPVDVTFGDYLRALVTADADVYPEDADGYRVAFVDAFRDRGIYPRDVRALGEDSLRWNPLDDEATELLKRFMPSPSVLQTMTYAYDCESQLVGFLAELDKQRRGTGTEKSDNFGDIRVSRGVHAKTLDELANSLVRDCWFPTTTSRSQDEPENGRRFARYRVERVFKSFLWEWIFGKAYSPEIRPKDSRFVEEHLGLNFEVLLKDMKDKQKTGAALEVDVVRPTVRLQSDGRTKTELRVVLTQTTRQKLKDSYRDENNDEDQDGANLLGPDDTPLSFQLCGGCTLIIDPDNGRIRYSITKRVGSTPRRARHADFLKRRLEMIGFAAINQYGMAARDRGSPDGPPMEPFAITHRSTTSPDV